MAELLLKVGSVSSDTAHYHDGDIVCAFNSRRIRCVHAEHICHIQKFGFNSDGLRPDSLAKFFVEQTSQYRFERISGDEIRRVELATMKEEIFSNTPNGEGQAIDVQLYIERRIRHPKHRIFGKRGAEFWYGGLRDVSNTVLNKVWAKIERDTPEREINYTFWPLTSTEKRNFLAVSVNDFDDTESELLVEHGTMMVSDDQEIVHKRKRHVDWRSVLSGRTVKKVGNPIVEVDNRGATPLQRSAIVSVKV